MPTIRKSDNGRSCATCRFYRTVEHHPADNQHPEPFCGFDGMSLKRWLNELPYAGCEEWQPLEEPSAVRLYERLTGRRL